MKRKRAATISVISEVSRPRWPEAGSTPGRETTFQSVGVVAATLLDQIRKRRDAGQ